MFILAAPVPVPVTAAEPGAPSAAAPKPRAAVPVSPDAQRLCDIKYLSCLDRARYEKYAGEQKDYVSSFEKAHCEREKRWCLKQAALPPPKERKPPPKPAAKPGE